MGGRKEYGGFMEKGKENHRRIGTVYENKAVLFLQEKGYQILERNFYTHFGEIDIIAMDGTYLVFVEVKYRKGSYRGAALEAVTPAKRRRIVQSARYYIYKKYYREDVPCRFDVIAFEGENVVHVPNAF